MTVAPVRSNVEQVERLLSALSAGDDATVLGLVDPAVELVPLAVAAGLVPDAYHGLDGIRAYLEDADAADVERGFVATRVRGAQDMVVAFGDLPAGAAGDTMPALWIWRLREGQVTHGTLVSDEGALRAARAARRRRAAGAPPPCGLRCPRCPRAPATRATWWALGPEPEAHQAGAQRSSCSPVSEAATNVDPARVPRRHGGRRLPARRRDQRRRLQVVVSR